MHLFRNHINGFELLFSLSPEITLMSKIARLETSTSFQLEAEQVIADLSSAVKELIENSLDSNPQTISIC